MKQTAPPLVLLVIGTLLTLACVADTSAMRTPVITPTVAPPTLVIPAGTPVLPPPPVAPAAGTYFGSINAADAVARTITFSAICVGADRKVMHELPQRDKAPRTIPLLSTTAFSLFTSPPNNPGSGRLSSVDLKAFAEQLPANAASKWFMVVNPQGVATIEQDSGVRPTAQPADAPCPSG
jgi:hypothetical protein